MKKLGLILLPVALLLMAASGNLNWDQLRSSARHGTGAYGQASDGTGPAGGVAIFDGNGNISSSANVAYASKLTGGHAPCNLSTGLTPASGACTDDTSALNAFLATATANNPVVLIQDMGSSVTGVKIPSSGHVAILCTGWDSGYFLASGSYAHVIRSATGATDYTWNTTPGTPGADATISGCRISGNRPNNIGSSWTFGIALENMDHVRLRNNWLYDVYKFAILCNACTDAVFDGNRLDAPSGAVNQDGIHVDGPSNQIRISNNWCNTSDDCIAMNAGEGFGGTIDGVAVTNSQCVGCLTAYRQLSSEPNGAGPAIVTDNSVVKNVTISNYAGTIASANSVIGVAFRLGELWTGSKNADVMQDVSIANVHFSSASTDAYMIEINDNLGKLDVNGLTWDGPAGANAAINFRSGATVGDMSLRGIKVYRSTAGNAAAWLLNVPSGDAISTLHLNGIYFPNEDGQSYSAVSALITVPSGGSISTMGISDYDATNVSAIASSSDLARISSLGTGRVLGTASFSLYGGSVSSLVTSGIITGVSRNSTGNAHISLAGTATNYVVSCLAGTPGVAYTTCGSEDVAGSWPTDHFTVSSWSVSGGSPYAIDGKMYSVVIYSMF